MSHGSLYKDGKSISGLPSGSNV